MTNKEAIEILKRATMFEPTLENRDYPKAFDLAIKALEDRPTGKREFIEIIAHYVPDDICTYPEYRGKPYYEIRYKENGEEHIGYGTYNLKVLSEFLRDYFL